MPHPLTPNVTANVADPLHEFLTEKQVAEALQLSTRTVKRLRAAHQIPFYRLGRSVRFKAAEVSAAIERKCRVGARSKSPTWPVDTPLVQFQSSCWASGGNSSQPK
ncbi:MAG: helix-turn-helix domain-containing protein [Verrucomicrobia bacterium]|nr:helix-turn-helix domain-containing protein [Verrucomicrobiota bacterium]